MTIKSIKLYDIYPENNGYNKSDNYQPSLNSNLSSEPNTKTVKIKDNIVDDRRFKKEELYEIAKSIKKEFLKRGFSGANRINLSSMNKQKLFDFVIEVSKNKAIDQSLLDKLKYEYII